MGKGGSFIEFNEVPTRDEKIVGMVFSGDRHGLKQILKQESVRTLGGKEVPFSINVCRARKHAILYIKTSGLEFSTGCIEFQYFVWVHCKNMNMLDATDPGPHLGIFIHDR